MDPRSCALSDSDADVRGPGCVLRAAKKRLETEGQSYARKRRSSDDSWDTMPLRIDYLPFD